MGGIIYVYLRNNIKGGEDMDKEQTEKKIFEILKNCRKLYTISYNLSIISDEFKNRIPSKHHEVINDLIIYIDDIADELSDLEKEIYHEYLTLYISEEEEKN